MKKIIILFGLIIIATTAFAQTQWQWATKAGGIYEDKGFGITIDNAGNTYVTGRFRETATFGSYSITSNGDYDYDIFLAKMGVNGDWQWAKGAGGSDYDIGRRVTSDAAGNSYFTGNFEGTATFGSYSITSNGSGDIFVAKMGTNGNWQWAKRGGGGGYDIGYGITIDAAGNSYVTGYFKHTATFGSSSITSNGEEDIFVAKMDTNGNWQWATKAGGSDYDIGRRVTSDAAGNSYVTGGFLGTVTFGSYSIAGYHDIFVAKMDANGNWQWATKAGGNEWTTGRGITIDAAGNSYVTGVFEGTATFGSYSITADWGDNVFVAKMDENGNWQWAKRAGGSYSGYGYGITIDSTANAYVTGRFEGTSTFGSYSLTSQGFQDIFVAKMDENGNWQWGTKAGGSESDEGRGITIDDDGNTYVTGWFRDTATFGSYSITTNGDWDNFVAKLDISHGVNDDFTDSDKFIKQNIPNPFDINTSISYLIPHNCKVEIEIYNVKGKLVKTLVDEYKQSGEYIVDFNSSELSSGLYFYKMDVDGKNRAVKKMVKIE